MDRSHLYYVLDENNEPVPVDDVLVWAQFLEANNERRTIAKTEVGKKVVWTYFLGLDCRLPMPHLWPANSKPILWETATGLFGVIDRYDNAEAAAVGHEQAVAILRAARAVEEEEQS